MKKILALILAAMMLLSVVACDKTPAETPDVEQGGDKTDDDTTVGDGTDKDDNTVDTDGVIAPVVDAGTLGEAQWNAFVNAIGANAQATAEELANTLVTDPAIQFMGGAMPLDTATEFFTGFDEYKITGFESAAVYMPMIGSIPFVGYVFDLAEGTDVAAFIQALTDNCNPRWNICVTAEQTVAGAIGDKVFFLMCPASMGDGSEEGGNMGPVGGVDVIYPVTLEEGTFGYAFWVSFEDMMIEGVNTTAEEIANGLCMAEIAPFKIGAMPMEVGNEYFPGFDEYKVTDYASAAAFMPMIGSIPFIGYIFQVEEGVDVANFVTDLAANCNPAWNICVRADETLVGAYGNTVFFLMCPASIEE